MRKSFLYMMRKTIPWASLVLLLTVGMTLMGVNAQATILAVDPAEYTAPAPDQTFVINVTITDVTSLAGYEFQLWYNSTVIKATKCVPINKTDVPAGVNPIGTSFGPGKLNASGYFWTPINNNVTQGLGRIWVIAAFPIGKTFTGSATAISISWKARAEGETPLTFNYSILAKIVSGKPQNSTHSWFQGHVTVVPEFSAAMVTPLLLIATLVAAIIGKMLWSRKRKDDLIAE